MLDELLLRVKEERKRQDTIWGANRHQDDGLWLTILIEEAGEVALAILNHQIDGVDGMKQELIHTAAVALAWLEDLESR